MGTTVSILTDYDHAKRLKKLLHEMACTGCVSCTVGYGRTYYDSSINRGYCIVQEPDKTNMEEYNAYVNLKYHAEHPGALFMNDEVTRAGVEMALWALEAR